MKNFLPVASVIAVFFLLGTAGSSCKKSETDTLASKEDLVLGKWNINRMQIRIYSGGVFLKDSIIPQTPKPDNFVNFDASGSFQYRFNVATTDAGSYSFVGADSLIAIAGIKSYRWKMLTLTKDLFTVMTTSTTDANFPGALVENYQTFVRYK